MNDDSSLNICGCCQGEDGESLPTIFNAPGQDKLAYRIGNHGQFNHAMQVGISGEASLRALATRDSSDPAIALLDSWAVVLDVLTFYQERIANEGFLRTATERRSILELARAIGYELRPGVAADVYLAFTLEKAEGSPESITIPVGSKAQSVPGQDEQAQTFETTEEIEARRAWNELKPQQFVPSLPLKLGGKTIYLDGTGTSLNVGDTLLFIGDERKNDSKNENWDFRRVAALQTVSYPPTKGLNAGYTIVTLDRGLGSFMPVTNPTQKNPEVYALRQRASIFGYNATDWDALPATTKSSYPGGSSSPHEWPNFTLFPSTETEKTLDLDMVYPKIIAAKNWLVLCIPDYEEVYKIKSAVESARAEFGLSGKTTRLTLGAGENFDKFKNAIRAGSVYAQAEQLAFADAPRTDDVAGAEIIIDPAVDGLKAGQLLSVTGKNSATNETESEIVGIKTVESENDTTRITLVNSLQNSYLRSSVIINANVASATHGETKKDEALGSGDGSIAFQKFTLKQKPLTYVSAAIPGGAKSTLSISVKGVLWHEVSSFYGAGRNDRVFVTRRADDGDVTVEFGDGQTGARLPSGQNNVVATYRVGTGLAGVVDADTITTLLSRPLGLKEVTNPTAATGGAEPEELEDARTNAPLTVLTLDRIVSIQDFEDFTRAFSGIGKAQAILLWNGERQQVHLTVAATDGSEIGSNSETFNNLLAAIDAARHTDQPVSVSPHEALSFTLSARVATKPDYVQDDVFTAIKEALTKAFSFEERDFGQGITASEVLAVMQNIEGVIAVDLELLDGKDPIANPNIPARMAYWDSTTIHGAELLLIDSDGITLTNLPL